MSDLVVCEVCGDVFDVDETHTYPADVPVCGEACWQAWQDQS